MSKGFITGTNEELIKAYKESRDESYLKELIEASYPAVPYGRKC